MLILQSASVDIGILSRATAFDAHQKIDIALSGNKIAANSGPEHRQTLNGVARTDTLYLRFRVDKFWKHSKIVADS